jgi:hypothetical protein
LRLQEQNALATAKRKASLEAQKIAGNRKSDLEKMKIPLQEKKEREEEESKIATKIAEEGEAATNEFYFSATERSKVAIRVP